MKQLKLFAIILLTVYYTCSPGDSANIVFFFGFSSYSHRVPVWPLATALAEKGHNVTFISPFPGKSSHHHSNIKDYVPKSLSDWMASIDKMGLEHVYDIRKSGNSLIKEWFRMPEFGKMMCEAIYKDKEYKTWIKSGKVDLLFIDGLFNECALGMAHLWGAKIILFQTTTAFSFYTDSFGFADETSWLPAAELGYSLGKTMTSLRHRMMNKLLPVIWEYIRKWRYFPKLEEITKKAFDLKEGQLPTFEEIERNLSLVMLNTHWSEEFPRSLPPNTISIGGIAWTGKLKKLPEKLDKFLGKGNGFIYISFGSWVDFMRIGMPQQQAFINALRSFPHVQFVWKVANDSLQKEFPNGNVIVDKWMPQQELLAHPKIKAFITHSGLVGIQEAVENTVPLICFPIFAEQDYNAERVHRKEYGIQLEITNVTQSELEYAINEITTNNKYKKNMNKISTFFKDRPQPPLETALWWTEFVLKHDQDDLLSFLRPLGINQPWWKKRGLDVWAIVLATVLAILLTFIFTIWKLLKKLVCASSPKPTKSDIQRIKKRQ